MPALPGVREDRAPRTCGTLGALAMAVFLGSTTLAFAQDAKPDPASQAEQLRQRAQELEATKQQQKRANDLRERMQAEVAAIGQDRRKLNQSLIDAAGKVREIETKIEQTEARLTPLDANESKLRETLAARRNEIGEVLAALQRAGRRAPPALFVTPEDALNSLRTAILLGSVVPEMRAKAETVIASLNELVDLRRTITRERESLAADRARLQDDQTRLAGLVDERQKQLKATEANIESENNRAQTLARQAIDLQGLIGRIERDIESAAKAAEAAAAAEVLAAAEAAKASSEAAAAAERARKNPARMTPAVAFALAKGTLPFPVNGTRLANFGGSDGAGGSAKGISLASRAGSQVTSPCDGWVVYAGPFRTYGQLLILNAGGGYHVLIAGMDKISVNIGQFVVTGEPVAVMGKTSRVASVLSTGVNQPVLYVEFRKDGTPIDPGPWWAASVGEKVRG